jgi:choline monooxygenase
MTSESSITQIDAAALAGGSTLPAGWYTEPEVLAVERREIFPYAWQYVGPAPDVAQPGQFMTANLAALPIVIARDRAGELHAMANVCQHRGAIVVSGKGACRAFKCPYHGWSYGLDGRLKSAPWMAEKPDPDHFSLPLLHVAECGPFVFAAREPADPFDRYIGHLPERLRAIGVPLESVRVREQIEYNVAANWKVLVENFSECYHCPTVHPYFASYVDLKNYEFEFDAYWFAQGGPDPRRSDPNHDDGPSIAAGLYVQLWPNVMLNVYPGEDNVSAMVVVPISHERSIVRIDFFFGDSASAADSADTVQFTDRQLREDWQIAESVQQGLASGAFRAGQLNLGVAAGRSEEGINRFQARVAAALNEPLGALREVARRPLEDAWSRLDN